MPVQQGPGSLTQAVYERLRHDVLVCHLAPGHQINVRLLAETLKVSAGAVREALSRLAAEDLVIARPQRGFQVAPVSRVELLDLTAVRIEVEGNCLRRSIEAADLAWEARVVAAFHHLSRLPLAGTGGRVSEEWNTAHRVFHDALMSACGSLWTLRLHTMLFEQYSRYRALSLARSVGHRDLVAEHRRLMEAALSRDVGSVQRQLVEHIQQTTDVLSQDLE